jgi:hypothetical protein
VTVSRSALAERFAASDPAGLLYGAVISASVLVGVSAHADQFEYVVLATVLALGVYWLAHVYVRVQSGQFGGDGLNVLQRTTAAAVHEVSVLEGGVPAIVVYVAADLVGLDNGAAARAAVYFSVGLLVFVGYLGAHKAGGSGWAAVLDAMVAGLFGVVVVVAKTILH